MSDLLLLGARHTYLADINMGVENKIVLQNLNADLDLYIYDNPDLINPIFSSTFGSNDDEMVVIPSGPNYRIYIEVRNYAAQDSNYHIQIREQVTMP